MKRIGVKPETLLTIPEITPTIKSAVKGGFKSALTAMRFASDDEVIAKFLKKYDSIPERDRLALPWEAIAVSSGVNINHLCGSIVMAVTAHCATKSRLIAVTNHPDIMKKRVEFAKLPGGEKDRTASDIIVGAQPSAKGPTFIGKAVFGAAGHGKSKDDDTEDGEIITPAYEQTDIEDRLFLHDDLDDKLVKVRKRLLRS